MKIMNFFKDRSTTFWTITSIVVSILLTSASILIPLWATGFFTKTGPHLRIEATQQSLLVDVDKSVAPDVSVIYQDEKVANLRLIQIKVANVGTEGIVGRTDVIDPIKFSFPKKSDIKILGKPTIGSNPQEVDIKLESLDSSREFATNFDLLNPDNYFTLNFLYSAAEPIFPEVDGKIRNVEGEELTTLIKEAQPSEKSGWLPSQWWSWLLFAISVMFLLILLLLIFFIAHIVIYPFSALPKLSGEDIEEMIEEGRTKAAILTIMVNKEQNELDLEDNDLKEFIKSKKESIEGKEKDEREEE